LSYKTINTYNETYTIGVMVFFGFSVGFGALLFVFDPGAFFGILLVDSDVFELAVPFLFVAVADVTRLVAVLLSVAFVGVFSEDDTVGLDLLTEVCGTD
jgi:hypothetical protein